MFLMKNSNVIEDKKAFLSLYRFIGVLYGLGYHDVVFKAIRNYNSISPAFLPEIVLKEMFTSSIV